MTKDKNTNERRKKKTNLHVSKEQYCNDKSKNRNKINYE